MGGLSAYLKALSKRLGLMDRVLFAGYLTNPYAVIAKASFFISTSRNDSFPNALLESMALAKPCVFTSCDSGPAEIMGKAHHFKAHTLTESEYGVLITECSVYDVAAAIKLFEDESMLEKHSQQSLLRARFYLGEGCNRILE